MAVGILFFSAVPTAQICPKLHFCFMNYLGQPSCVESLPMFVIMNDCKVSFIHFVKVFRVDLEKLN